MFREPILTTFYVHVTKFGAIQSVIDFVSDPQIMYEASLANAEFLSSMAVTSGNNHGNQEQITPLLSTLMYSQSSLHQV